MKVKLSEPKVITFAIAVLLALLAFIGLLAKIPFLGTYAFWVLLVGFILLAAGNFFKGL